MTTRQQAGKLKQELSKITEKKVDKMLDNYQNDIPQLLTWDATYPQAKKVGNFMFFTKESGAPDRVAFLHRNLVGDQAGKSLIFDIKTFKSVDTFSMETRIHQFEAMKRYYECEVICGYLVYWRYNGKKEGNNQWLWYPIETLELIQRDQKQVVQFKRDNGIACPEIPDPDDNKIRKNRDGVDGRVIPIPNFLQIALDNTSVLD